MRSMQCQCKCIAIGHLNRYCMAADDMQGGSWTLSNPQHFTTSVHAPSDSRQSGYGGVACVFVIGGLRADALSILQRGWSNPCLSCRTSAHSKIVLCKYRTWADSYRYTCTIKGERWFAAPAVGAPGCRPIMMRAPILLGSPVTISNLNHDGPFGAPAAVGRGSATAAVAAAW
jgi:hypothetical protein